MGRLFHNNLLHDLLYENTFMSDALRLTKNIHVILISLNCLEMLLALNNNATGYAYNNAETYVMLNALT